MIGALAWGIVWTLAFVGLLYIGLNAGHWLEERKELKKLRAWLNHWEENGRRGGNDG